MLKKILWGVAIVVVAMLAYVGYIMMTTRNHSPAAVATQLMGEDTIRVSYCRPFKKGRVIFGEEASGALQPYGVYWRLGANEATEITFPKAVSFAGESVAAGTYRMYAVPGANNFEVVLNSELGQWGYYEPHEKLDVVRVKVPVEQIPEKEQFEILFSQDSVQTYLHFDWDQTRVTVPISQQ